MAIPSAQQPIYNGAARVDVTRWQGNWGMRTAEVTTSANVGTAYAPVIIDPSWSFDMPQDDPSFPQVLGFTPGLILASVYFKHSSKADKVTNTIVEAVEMSSDSTADVPRVTVRGKGGSLTYNVAPGVG